MRFLLYHYTFQGTNWVSDAVTFSRYSISSGQRHHCAEDIVGAHLVNSRSRTCWAMEKAGWMNMKVEMWEMFPPKTAGTMESTTFFSVPSWRARIPQASFRLRVNSSSHWVEWGGYPVSDITINLKKDWGLELNQKLPVPQGHVPEEGQECPHWTRSQVFRVPFMVVGGGGGGVCLYNYYLLGIFVAEE